MIAGTSMEFGFVNYLIVSVLLWLMYDTVRFIATVTLYLNSLIGSSSISAFLLEKKKRAPALSP